jgi:pimeloyl-ACP methyl ester carboxylesterase
MCRVGPACVDPIAVVREAQPPRTPYEALKRVHERLSSDVGMPGTQRALRGAIASVAWSGSHLCRTLPLMTTPRIALDRLFSPALAALPTLTGALLADPVPTHAVAPPADAAGAFVTVDGVRTYFRVQGHGPAVVLLHGLGSSHLTWSATTRAFAEHFTVYALDMPGFGYSEKPRGYASARHEAAFVDRFLATVGVERATIVGHSMGGATALWLAAEHPARVERLIVVDAAEIGEAATVFRLVGVPILGELLLRCVATPGAMRALMSGAYLQKQVLTFELARQYARFAWTPGARRALIEHARSYDEDRAALLPKLGTIRAPALIVWGEADPWFPVAVGCTLANLLPSAQLTVIDTAGHLPQEEQPTKFANAVIPWLTAASRRPARN